MSLHQQANGVAGALPKRLSRAREKLKNHNLDAFLVSSSPNRYYFTGWQGDSESGFLLITPGQALLLTDSRYTEEVSYRVHGWEVVEYTGSIYQAIGKLLAHLSLRRIGIESHELSIFGLRELRKNSRGHKIVPIAHFVEDLRLIKDDLEIKLLKKAAALADETFQHILGFIKIGRTEREVALEMESFMKKIGAQKGAWEAFIVASGPNSSMVHYPAGERRIKKGDQILLDWGAVYQGYHSDISRVVFVGPPTAEQKRIYKLVLEAQKRGLEKVKIGKPARTVDRAARKFLEGKTEYVFGHGVGHGVGLEIHELPRINPKATNKFEVGQVITVEPGIYIPGWGGVRIEDSVLVTEKGAESLTKAPKEIEKMII